MSFAAFEEAPNGNDPFNGGNEEADPAADFLARQQDEMADLEETPAEPEAAPEVAANDVTESMNELSVNGNDQHQNGDSTPTDPYSAIHHADRLQQEPETIKLWREQFSQRIVDKDEVEATRLAELREAAAKELADWERHYAEQTERQQATNREAEKEFIKQRDEEVPGSEWERVCWLCDFNPKTSKQVKDVSRMRGLLLQLKQQQQSSA